MLRVRLHQHALVLRRYVERIVNRNLVRRDLVRIIHRVEHALRSEHIDAELDGRLPRHAARRDPDIVAEIMRDLVLELDCRLAAAQARPPVGIRLHPVEAIEQQRHRLARMADDEPELGMAVEGAREDQPHRVHPHFVTEAGERAGEAAEFVRVHPFGRRAGRMDVERGVEMLQRLQDRREGRLVEIVAARMGIQHRAVEAEPGHAALDLRDRALHVLRREGGEAGEPVGIFPAGRRQPVVRQRGEFAAFARVQHLHARRRQQQKLAVDPELVHALDPALADIAELLLKRAQRGEHRAHAQRRIVGRAGAVQ